MSISPIQSNAGQPALLAPANQLRIATTTGPRLYQLLAQLERTRPSIWRRLSAPSDCSIAEFRRAIRAVFGWPERPRRLAGNSPFRGRPVTLADVAPRVGATLYHARGSSWSVAVRLEAIVSPSDGRIHCLGGRRASPPLAFESPEEYALYLHGGAAFDDPRLGVDPSFDPANFDLEDARDRLARLPGPRHWSASARTSRSRAAWRVR